MNTKLYVMMAAGELALRSHVHPTEKQEMNTPTPAQAGALALVEAFEDAVIRRMRAYNPDDPMPKDGGSIREELAARNALLAALGAQAVAVLNVREFGAVGDGDTDDTAALQAAANWSAQAGAELPELSDEAMDRAITAYRNSAGTSTGLSIRPADRDNMRAAIASLARRGGSDE